MSPLEAYITLIHYWQQNPCKVKGEVHHIIPQSLGGPDLDWNKVKMPTLDHIEAHSLLMDLYPTGKEHKAMCAAFVLVRTSREGILLSPEEAAKARDAAREAMVGFKHSPETRKKLSEIAKQRPPMSEKTKRILSEKNRGRPGTMKGRKHSLETRQRMSETRKGMPQPWKRVPQSEETKKKLSEALKGRKLGPMSEEHKRHLSESRKSKHIAPWNKGVPRSEETKQKIRDAWAKKRQAKLESNS